VLSAVYFIAEALRLTTPTTIKNYFVKCGFSNDVSINDDIAKLTEDEEDDWHSLQSLRVQSEDYPTCDSALEVCGVQRVYRVLDQYLTDQKKNQKKRKLQNIKQHSWTH
jgi:hypothetical protein